MVRKRAVLVGLFAAVLLVLAGCAGGGGSKSASGSGSGAGAGGKLTIAFLMPCSTCASRYESQDKPEFTAAVKKLDPSATVIAENAQGDSATQLSQAEAALTAGANVLVVNPFDENTGAAIVAKAHAVKVPVISYDALITNAPADFYLSYDNVKVGRLQGQYLVDNLAKGAAVAVMNGAPGNGPAAQFEAGVHQALDPAFKSAALKNVYETNVPNWDPSNAQQLMAGALTKVHDKVNGVIGSNDGDAGGIAAALAAQSLGTKVLLTGQDATLAGLQRILQGTQSMTVYKNINNEATAAAKLAVTMGQSGTSAAVSKYKTASTPNGSSAPIPSDLLNPVVVTKANVSAVVNDHVFTWAEICKGIPASACPSQ
jgi:D-xylose transport system substrate-binding protein